MDSLSKELRAIFDLEGSGRLLLYIVLVGVVAGLACGCRVICMLRRGEVIAAYDQQITAPRARRD